MEDEKKLTGYENSNISKYYAGKSVFITGATGFVGLNLVCKLLTGCPNVNKIYLLLRPKKNKKIEDRLKDLTKNPVRYATLVIIKFSDFHNSIFARYLKHYYMKKKIPSLTNYKL